MFAPVQSNMSDEIEQALNLALRRLVTEITRNGELVRFQTKLQQRKLYDVFEKDYIENQRLRKELGNEYESSDSEQEKENNFNNLSKNELKKMMRKKLIESKFDEDVLIPVPDREDSPQKEGEEFATTRFLAEEGASTYDIRDTDLNIIKQAGEIVENYEEEKETNFGLQFLISQLEKIEKIGVAQCMKTEFSL